MDEVKKSVMIPGMNPLVKHALDQQIKQLKQLQGMLGKPALKKQIDATPMNQDQKDYVYIQMGWL
jgi:hypothetical protein